MKELKEKANQFFNNSKNITIMNDKISCSISEEDYIDARMKPVEDIMRNPSKDKNAQKNVEDTIDGLCEELLQCSNYIQNEFGKLCAKYGLDWYADEKKDNT